MTTTSSSASLVAPYSEHGVHRARVTEIRCLLGVARFGYLRATECGLLVWPDSPARSQVEMARRTLLRLCRRGWILERRTGLGGTAFVLAAKGADIARSLGELKATAGYDISIGPSCYHRTLTTNYLVRRETKGESSWGEYGLAKGAAPATCRELKEHLGRIPDGVVLVDATARHGGSSVQLADVIETESSWKPTQELERVLSLGWKLNCALTATSKIVLDRLVVIYDRAELHEVRIRRAAVSYARKMRPELARVPVEDVVEAFADLFEHVELVRVSLTPPLRITAMESVTLLTSLREGCERGSR